MCRALGRSIEVYLYLNVILINCLQTLQENPEILGIPDRRWGVKELFTEERLSFPLVFTLRTVFSEMMKKSNSV